MQRYHQKIALATISALCPVLLSSANAEGVVFESSVDAYKIGQIIASGEAIELPAGAQIKILSRDGEQIIVREPMVYDAENAKVNAPSQPSAFEVAIWNKRRADIGGTRGDRFEDCLKAAEKDPTLDVADCEQLVSSGGPAPQFMIENASVRAELRPSQALRVKMVADFNAIANCRLQNAGDPSYSTDLALGPNGERSTLILADTPKHIPQRGVPAQEAPSQSGDYTVTCLAVSASAFDLFERAMEGIVTPADRELLTARFAEIRGEPVVLSTLSFTVSDK